MSVLSLNPSHSHGSMPIVFSAKEKTMEIPELLNEAMALLTSLRSHVMVDETHLDQVFNQLTREFPELKNFNFLENYTHYTDEELERAQEWVASKQALFALNVEPFPSAPLASPIDALRAMKVEAPSLSSRLNINPGYLIIDLGEKFERRQIELIMKHDQENKRTIEQLNILNNVQTDIMSLRDKQPVDMQGLREKVERLHREFPEIDLSDILTNHASYTDDLWDRTQEKVSNKEKILMSLFNPKMMEIEELISDKNKIHEILSDIIKQLNEAMTYFIRKQVN